MFKKIILLSVIVCTAVFSAAAYNPPAGGETLYELFSPSVMAGAGSAAGGGLFSAEPESIALNPSLTAGEQRWVIDIAYTSLISAPSAGYSYGQAFQLGFILPSRFGVASFDVQGIFAGSMNFGNAVFMRGGFSKDITDKLFVGAALNAAAGRGWALNLDLGFLYNIKRIKWLPFLKDARWGASLTGMGKPYITDGTGIYAGTSTGFPAMFTPRVGVAGELFSAKNMKAGMSADFSAPSFVNLVFNTGVQIVFADIVHVKTGWEVNLRELLQGTGSLIPTAGVSFKFGIKTGDKSFLSKQGWQQSEIVVSSSYKYLDSGIHAASAGASVYLGQEDAAAPEIELWGSNE